MRIIDLQDSDLKKLISNRWESSASLWSEITAIYDRNKAVYDGSPPWVKNVPKKYPAITNGRIFTNTEAVINSVINNPPQPNIVPSRESDDASEVAAAQEKYFTQMYKNLNVKEELRRSLRDLYFCRLMVLKPYWNPKTDEIDVKRVDPRNIRIAEDANDEEGSEFIIEEIPIKLKELVKRYNKKEKEILEACGMTSMTDVLIKNPTVKYKEAWIDNYLIVQFKGLILWKGKNPYWDWDGLLVTKQEHYELLDNEKSSGDIIRRLENAEREEDDNESVKEQEARRREQEIAKENNKKEGKDGELPYEAYLFNHFDIPRKPYIFATILKNEDGVIGNTSFIEMATPLAEAADRSKMQIYKNARMVNGITKVDSSVMTKEKAQQLRYDPNSIIWGKNVVAGVQRETGGALPSFVFEDLKQSLEEIDNIMAATSAFRGEREGQETRGGRLALIEQSFLRLNELVQVVDYVSAEIFNWWYQLAKVRYTERHYMKDMGEDKALESIELSREDFEKGAQIRVIPGKTLPEDRQFKYSRAQADAAAGIISPLQYLKDAGYDNPLEVAQEAFNFQQQPAVVLGLVDEQMEGENMTQAMPAAGVQVGAMQAPPTLEQEDMQTPPMI